MKGVSLILVCVLIFLANAGWAGPGLSILRDTVAIVNDSVAASVLTLRVHGGYAWIAQRNGDFWSVDLATGRVSDRQSFSQPLIDFAILDGKPAGLAPGGKLIGLSSGMVSGSVLEQWLTDRPAVARLETFAGDALMSGDGGAWYLAANSTQSIRLSPLPLAVPFRDGLIWSLARQKGGRVWQIELLDMFGNRMKRLYRFSGEFDPTGAVMGPIGPEGEILISFFTGTTREFLAVGPNGRMLWRVPGPNPLCDRDFAWDEKGGLLVLEAQGTGVAVARWKFVTPEG